MNRIKYLIISVLGKIADVVTTTVAVSIWGIQQEGNIIVRNLMNFYNVPIALGIIFVLHTLLSYHIFKHSSNLMLATVAIISVGVPLWNACYIVSKLYV